MNRHRRPSSRRGVALLIVLAALVVMMSALVTTARLATTVRLDRDAGVDAELAEDLRRQVEGMLVGWLDASDRVVLPADVEAPSIGVLHHAWSEGDTPVELIVTAFDQRGMVPVTGRGQKAVRSVLPPDAARRLETTPVSRGTVVGLDLFESPLTEAGRRSVFPAAAPPERRDFGAAPPLESPEEGSAVATGSPPPAFGALVATHHPGTGGIINVNTAPAPLVHAAFRAARRDGAEAALEARDRGESAILGAPADARRSRAMQVASSSDAWAFRIDLRVGLVRRSWWCVYTNSRREPWTLEQRLAITD